MGGPIYMLDARIDVSAEAQSLISKHNLGSRVIYESERGNAMLQMRRGILSAHAMIQAF
jgi:hypothetical protein